VADFAQCGATLNETLGINNGQGTSVGTAVTSSATIYVKGAYSQIAAATSFDSSLALIYIYRHDSTPTFMVDIAIGPPGSEQIIAANLFTRGQSATETYGRYLLPICIPAGSRISARVSSNTTGAQFIYVTVTLFGSGFSQPPAFGGVELITNISIGGVEVASQNLNSTGGVETAWLGHNANPTPRDYKAISIFMSGYCPGGIVLLGVVDFALGPSGSEVPFLTDIAVVMDPTSAGKSEVIGPLPIPIPAGSRVSTRIMYHTTGHAANYLICGIYGFY